MNFKRVPAICTLLKKKTELYSCFKDKLECFGDTIKEAFEKIGKGFIQKKRKKHTKESK